MKEDIYDLFNARVRQAISSKYVDCMKDTQRAERRCFEIHNDIKVRKDTITMKEYNSLKREMDDLDRRIGKLKIAMDIWDQAREICLNIADEMIREQSDGKEE